MLVLFVGKIAQKTVIYLIVTFQILKSYYPRNLTCLLKNSGLNHSKSIFHFRVFLANPLILVTPPGLDALTYTRHRGGDAPGGHHLVPPGARFGGGRCGECCGQVRPAMRSGDCRVKIFQQQKIWGRCLITSCETQQHLFGGRVGSEGNEAG